MSLSRRRRAPAGGSCEQPLHAKGDKARDPAPLSRFPISSRNYASNCFSFTSAGTINGLEAAGRLALDEWGFKAECGLVLGEAAEDGCRPLSACTHPPGRALKARPRNHSLIISVRSVQLTAGLEELY